MRGQHYRARDKTVRKMGRDGLTEENLRSGETVRVSRRAADQLTLPKTADDSMNFQDRRSYRAEDKKTVGKHRGGYSPDFKRPDNNRAGDTQAGFYQADIEKTELCREDTGDTENYGENVQGMHPDMENVPITDTGIREGSGRQVPAQSSYRGSGRRKNYIPESLAARNRRNGRNTQQGKDFYTETGFQDRTSENTSDTESGSTPDMAAACEDTGTVQNGQEYPSRMENIREKPAGRNGIPVQKQKRIRTVPEAGEKNRYMTMRGRRKSGRKRKRERQLLFRGRKNAIRETSYQQGRRFRFPRKMWRKRAGVGGCIKNRKRRIPGLTLAKKGAWCAGRA